MQKFKEWLSLHEVVVADMPMTLKPLGNNKGFEVIFDHNGSEFIVTFRSMWISDHEDESVPDVYEVIFEGPQGVDSTGTSGTGASAIYSKVMAAIKKFVDNVPINGLTWSPYEPAMALVYKKFFKSFGKEFVQTKPYLYLKLDYLREKLKSDPGKRAGTYKSMLATARGGRETEKQIRAEKASIRPIRQAIKSMIGQIVTLKYSPEEKGQPYLVLSAGNEAARGISVLNGQPNVVDYVYRYLSPQQPDQRSIMSFLTAVQQGLPGMYDPNQVTAQAVAALIAKYGVKEKTSK